VLSALIVDLCVDCCVDLWLRDLTSQDVAVQEFPVPQDVTVLGLAS